MQRFGVHGLSLFLTLVLPCGDKHEMLVVAQRLTVGSLVFHTKMSTAALLTLGSVGDDEACQFEVVGQVPCLLQLGIHAVGRSRHTDVLVEIILQLGNLLGGSGQTLLAASHTAILPHDATQGLVVVVDGVKLRIES